MLSYLKQIGKDSLVYGLGSIFARGISFILLPVYTRLFSPSEYGIIEMLTVLNSFLGTVLMMGMDSAQSFYFFEQKDKGNQAQSQVVTSILQWRLSWGLLIVAIAMLLSPLLNAWFFGGGLDWRYFAIAFSGALFTQLMSQSAEVFRLLYRPWPFIGVTVGNTLGAAAISIVLVVWLDCGILGYFVGFCAGSFLAALVGWYLVRDYLDWTQWHRHWWPKLLRFGVPLLPAGIAMYVMNMADRWFVSYYHGGEALGFYSIGAKFAMLVALAVTTFRQAWWPIAMDAMRSPDGPELFRIIARIYLGVGISSVILLTALSPQLVALFTGPAFHSAYPIVGVLGWYPIFYGFFLIISIGIWKSERTILITYSMFAAACLNIFLDYCLVPKYGAIGAALGTSVSFIIWNIIVLCISERLWKIDYNYLVMVFQTIVGLLSCVMLFHMIRKGFAWYHIFFIAAVSTVVLIITTVNLSQLRQIAFYQKRRI